MSIEKQWCVFSAKAALMLGLTAALVGCPDRNPDGSGGSGNEGNTTNVSSSSSSSSTGNGGTGGAGGESSTGGGGSGAACDGAVVTVEQITNEKAAGAVGKGSPVKVMGAVAMSQKFLVSKSNSGTCLYGFFISSPKITETAPYSGIMVVSKGANAIIPAGQNTAYCGKISNRFADDPLPGDSIPDDIKPGDIVNVTGVADYFLLNACAQQMGGSQVAQRQIAYACAVERTGATTPPTPHAFTTPEDVAKLASSTDTAFHDQWGGVKVRVGVESTPVPQMDPGGGPGMVVVGKFGIINLATSNLNVGDKVYYRGYDKQACFSGPMFSDLNIKWTAIDGFNYLNYCTWDLEPDNKCVDFNPASEDCTGITCPPP